MMSRNPDIMFMTEYIKSVLYFATVRDGKVLKNTTETHYFCIDRELVYENYYSDFGPLNLGCVYKYCNILNDKLNLYLNKQTIVHYTSIDPKKKANSAYLLGCYGVLYLNLQPRDALKPLMACSQSYRAFQDATQGDSSYTISLMDCLQAIDKAKELGFFDFQDFNLEEYERLDKIQGGDLNWIVPGKFLAFIGPVDYSLSLYHPPDMYIHYFHENNVKIVIRLNKRLYDGNVFNNAGINHYDLYFPDGTCPPRHIIGKFLQISEESDGAIAVHCKAGLGRTGSLIGCYLMKHYRMTSHEAIGWMRICRPGSVIGQQQAWLEKLEPWLVKQGNIYRKHVFNDVDKFPCHEYGVYSIAEKTSQQRSLLFRKSPSPSPPATRKARTDAVSPVRSQASRAKEDETNEEEEEIFITACDLTEMPTTPHPIKQKEGSIIRNTFTEEYAESSSSLYGSSPLWKKILCCEPCIETLKDGIWAMSVRCARVAPETCRKTNKLCACIYMAAANAGKKDQFEQWPVRPTRLSYQKINQCNGRDTNDSISERSNNVLRQGSGSGEPRMPRSPNNNSNKGVTSQRNTQHKSINNSRRSPLPPHPVIPTVTTFRTTTGPVIKSVNDARNFLLRSSMCKEEREKQLKSSVTVTARSDAHNPPNFTSTGHTPVHNMIPSVFSTAPRGPTQPKQRRRLGRSPSPPNAPRISIEQSRATNTPSTTKEKFLVKPDSKAALREALSRLKLTSRERREGSIGNASVGAASLGARRDAPGSHKRAPSVRSDERPLATQGDLLNSIKFQRRLRDSLQTDKFHEKLGNREQPERCSTSKNFFGSRPSSPKARRNPNSNPFY